MQILLELTSTQTTGLVVLCMLLLVLTISHLPQPERRRKRNYKVDFISAANEIKGKIGRAYSDYLLKHYTKEIKALSEGYYKHIPDTLLNDRIGDLYATIENRRAELSLRRVKENRAAPPIRVNNSKSA